MSKTNAIWSTLFLSVFFGRVLGANEEREGDVSGEGVREEAIRKNYRQENLRWKDKKEPVSLWQRDGQSVSQESPDEEGCCRIKVSKEILNETMGERGNSCSKKEKEYGSLGVPLLETNQADYEFLKEAIQYDLFEEAEAHDLFARTEESFIGQGNFIEPQSGEREKRD
ncbi:MAG: uncharacterized protein A8A55_2502 [Amphiamblys sp. WSBS2006]|nr:MAG: uncharacterized protein A8A55_2502 [Amphiamblys sp. WSBS2006]